MALRTLLTHDIFSSQAYGGVSRYFTELLRAVHESPRSELSLEAFAGFHISEMLGPDLPVTGIKVPPVPKTRFLRHLSNEAWQRAHIRARGVGLLHVTYPFRDPDQYGVPFVFTVHDMIPELFPHFFPGGEAASLLKKRYCERAARIIAVSENTRQDLARVFDIPIEKIAVAHHGVRMPPNHRAASQDRPFLLYVGTLGLYKNFRCLVEAVSASDLIRKDFQVVVFGPENPQGHPIFLENRYRPFRDTFRWMGGDDLALLNCYFKATALIYPSLYEGFGLPILEAMAAGCPVLCSQTGALTEVAESAAAFFSPERPEELRHLMEKTLYEPQTLATLSGAGIERARLFSWEKTAATTGDIYLSAMG